MDRKTKQLKRRCTTEGYVDCASSTQRSNHNEKLNIPHRNAKRLDRKDTPDQGYSEMFDEVADGINLVSLVGDDDETDSFQKSDGSLEFADLLESDPDPPITPPSHSSLNISLKSLEENAKSIPRKRRNKVNIAYASLPCFDERMEAYESQCGISFPALDFSQDSDHEMPVGDER